MRVMISFSEISETAGKFNVYVVESQEKRGEEEAEKLF